MCKINITNHRQRSDMNSWVTFGDNERGRRPPLQPPHHHASLKIIENLEDFRPQRLELRSITTKSLVNKAKAAIL
jgi:hypothetical protein